MSSPPGRFVGGPSQEMPVEVGGRKVTWWDFRAGPEGAYSSISVEEPTGSTVAVQVKVTSPDGAIHILGVSQFQ